MPYKQVGKVVMVKRAGEWVILKKHATVEQAKAHAAALNIAVHDGAKRKKR